LAAEHAIAMMLALSRHIPDANSSVQKRWDRKSFIGAEVYKKLWALSVWALVSYAILLQWA